MVIGVDREDGSAVGVLGMHLWRPNGFPALSFAAGPSGWGVHPTYIAARLPLHFPCGAQRQ